MQIPREMYKEYFSPDLDIDTDNPFPSWPCPNCPGTLRPETGGLKHFQSADGLCMWDVGAANPGDGVSGPFAWKLNCAGCRETVLVVGDCRIHYGSETGLDRDKNMDTFCPRFFHPAVPMFPLGKSFPNIVKERTRRAFSVYWSDKAACVNAVRIVVEVVLDEKGVSRLDINDKNIVLHDRILEYGKRGTDEKSISDLLLAIKWIGNEGSHGDDPDLDGVLDCLDQLHLALQRIFIHPEITKQAAEINKQKGSKRPPAT